MSAAIDHARHPRAQRPPQDCAQRRRNRSTSRAVAVGASGLRSRSRTLLTSSTGAPRSGPIWLLVNYLVFGGTFLFTVQYRQTDARPHGLRRQRADRLDVHDGNGDERRHPVCQRESMIKGTALPLTLYVLRGRRCVVSSARAYSVLGWPRHFCSPAARLSTPASLAAIAGCRPGWFSRRRR